MKGPIRSILATDCGSTTTKAILIEREGEHYRLKVRGEAPTTVESPFDDVTLGVVNAVTEVQELRGRPLLEGNRIIRPQEGDRGVDLYLSTSSAGGGLQMLVAGVVRAMTAESAQRAALGAGAIVMDVISMDDRRKPHERVAQVRHLRPDIVLLAGGVDGGTQTHVVELAEILVSADPKPRFGTGFRLPVIYAGNRDARKAVSELLEKMSDLQVVDNIRPTLEQEELGPARQAIHEVFLKHVMSHAPGYDKLIGWADADILSTPNAVGRVVQTIAEEERRSVLAVDIGGATTDVFSVFEGTFNRTVSANLGMSYSMCNVMLEAGLPNIMRWIPFEMGEEEMRNRLRNKMIRPTTIPETVEDLQLEQAVCREALRLAFEHHKFLAVGLKGVQQQRTVGDAFVQKRTGESLVDLMALDMVIGSGGVLSHAPERWQAALMMIDAYQPEGITTLTVDSIFMMPQLGVLAQVVPEAAQEVFHRDCLIYLGTCIAPRGAVKREGEPIARIRIAGGSGMEEVVLHAGELQVVPLEAGRRVPVEIQPEKGWDMGGGRGRGVSREGAAGTVGLILDGRGRPLALSEDAIQRRSQLARWLSAMQGKGVVKK
jgi:uncharacterized protein (TIGR01319 family)